jgi:DNA polymerase III delta prime subunit
VQDLLKEVAQTQQVDLGAKQRFKVVVINEADHLTRDAQAALRRTMEKYSPNLRLILLANSTSNIIAPIRSRTLLVRVAAPTETEICSVLSKVGKKEGWKDVESLNQRIARDSGRNLRKALLMFEAVHAQKYALCSLSLLYANALPARRLQIKHTSRPQTGKPSSSKSPAKSSKSVLLNASYKSAPPSTTCSRIA